MIETQTRPAPVETVTPIKPSEAIRLGCLIAPVQAFDGFGFGNSACAAGAMNLGYGRHIDDWKQLFQPERCPAAPCPSRTWAITVFHLNDDHRWSRERIADWLTEQGL